MLGKVELELESWALSRISPRVRVRVSVSIVLGLATGGYDEDFISSQSRGRKKDSVYTTWQRVLMDDVVRQLSH